MTKLQGWVSLSVLNSNEWVHIPISSLFKLFMPQPTLMTALLVVEMGVHYDMSVKNCNVAQYFCTSKVCKLIGVSIEFSKCLQTKCWGLQQT